MKAPADIFRLLLRALRNVLVFVLLLPIRFYRRFISPLTPPACRYTPTCSQYAIEALRKHGPFKGLWLATYRILRCAPWGGWGYDPVPEKFSFFYYKKPSKGSSGKTQKELSSSSEDNAFPESLSSKKTLVTDVHTHNLPEKAGSAIVSLSPQAFLNLTPEQRQTNLFAIGIHPWYIEGSGAEQLSLLESVLQGEDSESIVMLGEMGLDKKQGASPDIQRSVFISQLELALRYDKIPVIHDVRSMQEILQLRKSLRFTSPWLIHGFRGGAEQAQQYLRAGCHLSLGMHYKTETLLSLPANEIFLESDDDSLGLANLYERVAKDLNTTVSALSQQVSDNVMRLLGK